MLYTILQGDFCTAIKKCLYSSSKQVWPTFILAQLLEMIYLHLFKNLQNFRKVFAIWKWTLFSHVYIIREIIPQDMDYILIFY